MKSTNRLLIALVVLLSGLVALPQVQLTAGVVSWQRFANGYEGQITVTRARCDPSDGELEVRALTSAGGNATLTVYNTDTNAFIGTLTYVGGNEHRGDFVTLPCPRVITVRSTQGGSATVLVWDDSGPPITVTPSASPVPTVTPTGTPVPPSPYRLHLPIVSR